MPGRRQSGLSLIEVLITVVLVSIGLLGLAGLQLTSVRNSSSSGERFIATTLAQDILERMRANRSNAVSTTNPVAERYDLAMNADPAAGTVAGNDLVAWTDALAAALPQGDGSVDVDDNDVATVVVRWAEAADIDADENQFMSLTLSTTL